MDLLLLAGMTFVTVTSVILAIWWIIASGEAMRARLAAQGPPVAPGPTVLRFTDPPRFPLLVRMTAALPWAGRLHRMIDRAGWAGRSGEALGLIILWAVFGGVIGGARLKGLLGAAACAVVGALIPVIYLRFRGRKRMDKFSEQLPDALDLMTRSLRTGYALGSAIQVVAEEMPDPIGPEFRRVHEEMSLGRPPTEALLRMCERMETEDLRFFYAAVSIQREVGGNLAEILEKLSEVIRERYKLLSFARVLSSQHRGSAYVLGASPFLMALMISLMSPGWFEALWDWRYGKLLILAALAWQGLGFLVIRRIASIKV
jgi:tight adherence protein B